MTVMDHPGLMRRPVLYATAWAVAVVVAIGVGLAAVETVGDAIRGRGPLGGEVIRGAADTEESVRRSRPDPDDSVVSRDLTGDWGTFTVACQGAYASGRDAVADTGNGWRVIRFEPGPDDDVDAVFSSRRHLVEIEVFCNRGLPTIAEIERDNLTDSD